ncbi:MAG TPA: hypothetical protein VFX37_07205 [Pseudolabrys sp.]|nr:hypothetical protein [Pseudolabrys sp.]
MAAIRRFIILAAQVLALPFILLCVFTGGLLGQRFAPAIISAETGVLGSATPNLPPYLGALGGLLTSLLGVAMLYVLVEIARNTKNPFE